MVGSFGEFVRALPGRFRFRNPDENAIINTFKLSKETEEDQKKAKNVFHVVSKVDQFLRDDFISLEEEEYLKPWFVDEKDGKFQNSWLAKAMLEEPTQSFESNTKVSQTELSNIVDIDKLKKDHPYIKYLSISEVGKPDLSIGWRGDKTPETIASLAKLLVPIVLNHKNISLDQKVKIPKELIADWEGGKYSPNLEYTVGELLENMLGSSHNTPFNFFVWDLGRVKGDETFIEAAYNFSSILNDLGFPETKLVNFLSKKVPGESREGNKSTPNEINRAMHTIYTGNSEVFKKSREALKNAPKENRFSHSNRVLNKIGLNSRGLMDTTIVEIDGKEYIITAIDILGENFDGVPGNDINVESYYNNGNNSISKITQDLIDARKSVS